MDNEENEINNANNLEEQQPKKSMTDYLHRANELRHDYQNAGSLTGMSKNAINNKINDKYNAVKKADKDTSVNRNANTNFNSRNKESDLVKNKREEIKNKQENINSNKNQNGKQNETNSKNQKKEVVKEAAKKFADSQMPGGGMLVEAASKTQKGDKILDKVADKLGGGDNKKTGEAFAVAIIKDQIKKQVISFIPIIVVIVIVVVIILGFVSKFNDSLTFFNGDAFGSSGEVDEKYEAFYENIDIYSKKYSADRAMMVAVLTAYSDNDNYSDMSTEDDSVEDVDPDEEKTEDNITGLSKSKMKKYIKKVAKAIKDSNYDISRGDFNDENSGSDFFWWLYDSFIDEYYSEYLDDTSDSKNLIKKQEIIYFIYLYYEEIKEDYISGEFIYVSCPNGVTVTGENAGTYDLEEYVAGVVTAENSYYDGDNIEAMKAQAIAARTFVLKETNNCVASIENSTTKQAYSPPTEIAKKAAQETRGLVLTYDGNLILAQYDHFKKDECSSESCTGTYVRIPSDETHVVTIPKKYLDEFGDLKSHGNGMSQVAANYMQDQGKTYEEILKYFYADGVMISTMSATIVGDLYAFGGTSGIIAESLFPISKNDIEKVYKSAGWKYPNGEDHFAVDIACNTGDSSCHSIGIYSSHEGVVTYISRDQCNSYSKEAAEKTGLPYKNKSLCSGTALKIKVTAGDYSGYTFWYYHLNSIESDINIGTQITAGQLLGTMGNTGYSTGPHLHFQITDKNGASVNLDSATEAIFANYK